MSRLTPEQAEAVGRREIDVFCEAGAGTGKTTVLVDRFVNAVCEDDIPMSDILAFTFTERAADQLRGRIRGALRARAREAGAAGDEERRLGLERLSRDTEAAWISTIHGFCRRLLASHPIAAGIDPRFRVLDEGESSRLRSRAFWAALDSMLSAGDPEAASRIVAAVTPKGLRSIVISAHDELRSRGQESALPDPPLVDAAAALAELGDAALEALADCGDATGKAAPEMLERMARARDVVARAAAGEETSLDDVIPLELKTTHQSFAGAACDRYREAWNAARQALAHAEMADSYELVRTLLVEYGAEYDRLKTTRSGLDFEDLQLRARDLLRHSETVRTRYSERFRHLLVDEFQDTNQVQRDLIGLLQGPETRLFCVGDELQSIYGFRHADLAVFRRERERFKKMDDETGSILPLTGNFRAVAEILGVVNAIGNALIDGFEPLSVGEEDQGATEPGATPSVELMLVATDSKKNDWSAHEVGLDLDEDEPAPAYRIAEARLLASRLAAFHQDGLPRGEMVVLLRSYTWVDTYERALADAGLDPYVIGGRGYWSQQQVEDVLAVLAVISNPLDDEALLGGLASPACAVTPDTLWLLRRVALDRRERGWSTRLWPALREVVRCEVPEEAAGRPWAEAIEDEELERLRLFTERIEGLREDAPLLGLEGTVQAACERLGYDLATLMRDRGEARWANVRKLMRLAREYESNDGADLRGFLEYAAEETARAGEGEAPIAAEEHDGVRIMTVHGAKGLEFEAVAVPELGRRILAGFPPAIRIGTAEPRAEDDEDDSPSPLRIGLRLARLGRPSERLYDLDALEERAKVEEAAEELRLAHVAFTRAKRKLILSGTYNPGKDPEKALLPGSPVTERLIQAFREGPLGASLALGESSETEIEVPAPGPGQEASLEPSRLAVTIVFPSEGAGKALSQAAADEAVAPQPTRMVTPPLLDLAAEQVTSARLSYSALSQYHRCGYRFLVERELGLGAAQAGGGLPVAASLDEGEADPGDVPAREARFGFGNAIHGLLEWSARNRWRRPDRERILRLLRISGLPGSNKELERAEGVLSGWLESPLCEELGETGVELRPEEPFLLPMEGTVIRGSIDLLARFPDGRVLVLDYKTDRLNGDPADLMERYSVQRDIYALAAAGDGPLRTAYVFLEHPDEPVEMEFPQEELNRALGHVLELLEGIAAGRFEVTRRPHAAICADCPAREHLCSHAKADQMRESGDPPVDPRGREAGQKPEQSERTGGEPQLSLLEGA